MREPIHPERRSPPRGKKQPPSHKTPEEQERKEGKEPNLYKQKIQNKDNPGKSTPEHRGTPRRGDPGEPTDQLGREGRNTLPEAKRRPGARRQNERASLEDQRRGGGKLGEQSPQKQTKKRETEKRNRTGRPTQRRPMNRRRRRNTTEEDGGQTIQPIRNHGTERNRDNVVKCQTPQGEERTGNPSSRKDKKSRNNSRPKQVVDRNRS